MIDQEKVIKGLNCCAHTDGSNCKYCPYDITGEDCTALMSMDVLALLKEQGARILQSEEAEKRKMVQDNWKAQMNMLGYDESGNPLP